ncbi:hypothetical protein B0919_00040 [Hymenobacter sp. CRA2]|nr:hypothetical protein B0919_00040 [Hymenobacter sp. CRA2]
MLLYIGSFFAPAQAQQPAPRYQFMHVSYQGRRIYFSPAYQGKEWVKVTDLLGERYTLTDNKELGWEAMSKLLNEFSAAQWELMNVLPNNSKDGNDGAIYLLRRPAP